MTYRCTSLLLILLMNLDIIKQFTDSNPPPSRVWKLFMDVLTLIPPQSHSQLLHMFTAHSVPVSIFNLNQFFLCLHSWLDFEDRLTCMVVNRQWREAIRQPQCWPTLFGCQGIHYHFPISCKFIRSMIPCWSQLNHGVRTYLQEFNDFANALYLWLELSPNATVDSLVMNSIHTYDSPTSAVNMLRILLPRISSTLRELDLMQSRNYRHVDQIVFPCLEKLYCYLPFQNCFVQAPSLKHLILNCDMIRDGSSFHYINPHSVFPRLEHVRFHQNGFPTIAQMEYYRHLVWPKTVRQIELVGQEIPLLILYLYSASNTHLINCPLELTLDFNNCIPTIKPVIQELFTNYCSHSHLQFQSIQVKGIKRDVSQVHTQRNTLNAMLNTISELLHWNVAIKIDW